MFTLAMVPDSTDDDTVKCKICENPCTKTLPITDKSIEVEEYSWLCYDPETNSETAYLHE